MSTRTKGYKFEDIAKKYFEDQGYEFVAKNFTMRWGEIDLIFKNKDEYIFVEVKGVDRVEDITDYITNKKLKSLKKTIQYFLLKNWAVGRPYQLDVVFVKDSRVIEHLPNIFIDNP